MMFSFAKHSRLRSFPEFPNLIQLFIQPRRGCCIPTSVNCFSQWSLSLFWYTPEPLVAMPRLRYSALIRSMVRLVSITNVSYARTNSFKPRVVCRACQTERSMPVRNSSANFRASALSPFEPSTRVVCFVADRIPRPPPPILEAVRKATPPESSLQRESAHGYSRLTVRSLQSPSVRSSPIRSCLQHRSPIPPSLPGEHPSPYTCRASFTRSFLESTRQR